MSLFVTFLAAFFASLDGVTKKNLAAQFASRCSSWRLVRFYIAMETVHSETHSLGIEQYVRDPAEWDGIFNVMPNDSRGA